MNLFYKRLSTVAVAFFILIVGFSTEAQAQCPTCTTCSGRKYVEVKIPPKFLAEFDCPTPCVEPCPRCAGKGTYCPPPPPNPCTCGTCGGDGKQTHHVIHTYETVELSCKTCGGDGNKCN